MIVACWPWRRRLEPGLALLVGGLLLAGSGLPPGDGSVASAEVAGAASMLERLERMRPEPSSFRAVLEERPEGDRAPEVAMRLVGDAEGRMRLDVHRLDEPVARHSVWAPRGEAARREAVRPVAEAPAWLRWLAGEQGSELVRSLDVDRSCRSLAHAKGRILWVLGAGPHQPDRPQIALERETGRLRRIVERRRGAPEPDRACPGSEPEEDEEAEGGADEAAEAAGASPGEEPLPADEPSSAAGEPRTGGDGDRDGDGAAGDRASEADGSEVDEAAPGEERPVAGRPGPDRDGEGAGEPLDRRPAVLHVAFDGSAADDAEEQDAEHQEDPDASDQTPEPADPEADDGARAEEEAGEAETDEEPEPASARARWPRRITVEIEGRRRTFEVTRLELDADVSRERFRPEAEHGDAEPPSEPEQAPGS